MRAHTQSPTVYLAGPIVFEPNPDETFAQMKAICSRHGLEGISPLDNQIGLERLVPGHALAEAIVRADIDLMHRVDAGVFCLDSFRRGPEMDAGTAFEIGYMHSLGKPLAGWTRDPREYPARVRDFFADVFHLPPSSGTAGENGARSGALRDPDGILIHSEGCLQNAMVHISIELSGGVVCAAIDWLAAFECAIANLGVRLSTATSRCRNAV